VLVVRSILTGVQKNTGLSDIDLVSIDLFLGKCSPAQGNFIGLMVHGRRVSVRNFYDTIL